MDEAIIVAAIISAVVSIVTVLLSFLLKTWFERNFTIFKLEAEHRYDQKKNIKDVIARNKTHLLNSAESLNHRLWNFYYGNYKKQWHIRADFPQQYYLSSFVYRFLAFFAWVRRVEREMFFLDTTVATREDLNFVKYLRLLNQVMCDTELFANLDYETANATDHFFKNEFYSMSEALWKDGEIFTFEEFKNNDNSCIDRSQKLVEFLNGMSPDEDRLRWDRLQALHYVLMMFLNSFGYDFQLTNVEKITALVNESPRPNKTSANLRSMIKKLKLNRDKGMLSIINEIHPNGEPKLGRVPVFRWLRAGLH
jgi:hypothetical protein